MAAPNVRTSSFSRNRSVVSSPQTPGLKCGPNGTTFVSTGIRDLDSEFFSLHLRMRVESSGLGAKKDCCYLFVSKGY